MCSTSWCGLCALRTCIEMRRSSSKTHSRARGAATAAGFSDPVSMTVCPYLPFDLLPPLTTSRLRRIGRTVRDSPQGRKRRACTAPRQEHSGTSRSVGRCRRDPGHRIRWPKSSRSSFSVVRIENRRPVLVHEDPIRAFQPLPEVVDHRTQVEASAGWKPETDGSRVRRPCTAAGCTVSSEYKTPCRLAVTLARRCPASLSLTIRSWFASLQYRLRAASAADRTSISGSYPRPVIRSDLSPVSKTLSATRRRLATQHCRYWKTGGIGGKLEAPSSSQSVPSVREEKFSRIARCLIDTTHILKQSEKNLLWVEK